MRKLVMLLGIVVAAVGCNAIVASAQRPTMGNHPSQVLWLMAQDSAPTPDPILVVLAQRLRTAFKHARLPLRVSLDGDVLVAEYHTHHASVHLRDMTGKESPRATDLVVPADDGVRLQLQLEPADYVDQAVRPQTRHESYRTSGDKRLKWTIDLDQLPMKKANKSLLVSFEHGVHVSSHWIDVIDREVRNSASETTQSAFLPGAPHPFHPVKNG